MNIKRFILTAFHNVTNVAKILIFLLKYLYAYKPSHKRNCANIKIPCTVKAMIPLHVYKSVHLSKSRWGLLILNCCINQVKLLDHMNWDNCFIQFHEVKLNSHESERINSYVISRWLLWALPLQPSRLYLHEWYCTEYTFLILGCFSFQTWSTSVLVLNSISRAMDKNIARANMPS